MQTSLESNRPIFKEQIERLQKGLKGTYTREQVEILFDNIKRFKVDQLTRTVEHLLITKTFLPPANDVIAGCRVEAYGDEQKEDREEKRFAKDFFEGKAPVHGQMAKEAMRLILDVLTVDKEGFFLKPKPKMTVPELYQEMLKMDDRWPGLDWRQQADLMMSIRLG
ncbi:MAG TPA: hypothetical protein DCY12_10660 [Candidatus Atribacteria bacterium]|nr:hypothetical protein [Candidatus Atribacteria bacterium]